MRERKLWTGLIAAVVGAALAVFALPACSQEDPGEIVIAATKATTDSRGTFEARMHLEMPDPPEPEGSEDGVAITDEEGIPQTDLAFSGAFDGSTLWWSMPPEYDPGYAEGLPTELGYLVRDGVSVETWEVDGQQRWFESEELPVLEADFMSSPDSLSPSKLLEEIRRAAADPSSVRSEGGEYQVTIASELLGLDEQLPVDPEEIQGYGEDPDGTSASLDQTKAWYEEKFRHEATVGIDDEGRVERVRFLIGLDSDEYPDCELPMFGWMDWDLTITYAYTETAPEIPQPTPEQIEPRKVLDELRGFPFSDFESIDEDWTPEAEAGAPVQKLQTVAGERDIYEVSRYLEYWVEEAGIDPLTVPLLDGDQPPDDLQQMVAAFDSFFTQHAEAEGGALETADGLWLPSHAREVLVDYGDFEETELDQFSRGELVALFDELYAESGGRGTLIPRLDHGAEMEEQQDATADEDWSDVSGFDMELYSLEGCPG